MLEGRVQVQWQLMGEDVQIRVSGRIREDQYVAFGLSGREGKAEMIGGDVVVIGYNNRTGKFIAEDYYMSDFAQCDGKRGVCPDKRVGGRNDAVLVRGERKNGVTTGIYIYLYYNDIKISIIKKKITRLTLLLPIFYYSSYSGIILH